MASIFSYFRKTPTSSYFKEYPTSNKISYLNLSIDNVDTFYKGGDVSNFENLTGCVGDPSFFNDKVFNTSFKNRNYYLLQLRNAELHGEYQCVLTPMGVLENTAHAIDLDEVLAESVGCDIRVLEEECLVVGNFRHKNYYHWVFQAVSSIIDVRNKKGYMPKLLVPPLNSWKLQYLELLGVGESDYIEMKKGTVVRAKNMLYSCFSAQSFTSAPHVRIIDNFEKLSESQKLVNNNICHDNIYISRLDSCNRSIVNENEVIQLLEEYGFKSFCLTGMPILDQISLFRNANNIIAPHGAGLVNILYSLNCITVTEIFPENYINSCFFNICQAKKIFHFRMASNISTLRGRHDSEFIVDIGCLRKHVEDLLDVKNLYRLAS